MIPQNSHSEEVPGGSSPELWRDEQRLRGRDRGRRDALRGVNVLTLTVVESSW